MKKLLTSLGVVALVVFSFVQAQTTLSIVELLKNASFGYDSNNQISISEITEASVTISSPVVKDVSGYDVYWYRLSYSPYLVEDLAKDDGVERFQEVKSKDFTLMSTSADLFPKFTLSIEGEELDKNTTYYALVTPIDMYDTVGTSSEQVCFNLARGEYDLGDKCLVFDVSGELTHHSAGEPTGEHGAAKVDMSLANVTHTINGNVITLRWTALEGPDRVDLYVFNLSEEKFVRIGEPKMTDEKFDYTMKRDGEHIFRLIPSDGGKEIVYNVQAVASTPTPPTEPAVPVVPETGPVENMLIILMVSGLIYVGYRYYQKRAY
ncbi:MAG: hypothetical protein LBI53_01815 [Candidatus Peribacteria bacterium]|jgi:hypothetical protein|nr:hypothetical protein [Candidatus Peribacteria bacterium]